MVGHSDMCVHAAMLSASVSSVSSSDFSAREQYQQKIQQRQAVVFSLITTVCAVLLLFALLIWSGVIPSPMKKGFSKAPDPYAIVTPCLIEGKNTPVDLSTLKVNYYNSTTRTGIAGEAAQAFTALGVPEGKTANWPSSRQIEDAALIQTNKANIAGAYTLARYIPGAIVQYDTDLTGDTINLILGDKWAGITDPESIDATAQLEDAQGCVPVSEIDQ